MTANYDLLSMRLKTLWKRCVGIERLLTKDMQTYLISKIAKSTVQKLALPKLRKGAKAEPGTIEDTLLRTMSAILEFQEEYFVSGDDTKLKPMILKDIAEMVKMDISTISRVANSKYIDTPFGTFLLKTFFSESMQTDSGEEVSTREVKKILQDCIEAEDKGKPLADEKLTDILKEKGYNIARRTVAKYREQLNIPVARLRKEL